MDPLLRTRIEWVPLGGKEVRPALPDRLAEPDERTGFVHRGQFEAVAIADAVGRFVEGLGELTASGESKLAVQGAPQSRKERPGGSVVEPAAQGEHRLVVLATDAVGATDPQGLVQTFDLLAD